jgi:spoIIIJ-associated protein
MNDVNQAAQTIGRFLQTFTLNGGLRLRFRVKVRGAALGDSANDANPDSGPASQSAEGQGKELRRTLCVEFSGPDTHLLTARNGEVLSALEHIAVKILRLELEDQELVSFDADHFKADRDRQMRESASAAVERVRSTGRPHPFPAMNSRDRRMLHLILKDSGLQTSSSGEGPGRFVVLYPEGTDVSQPAVAQNRTAEDAGRLRHAFRHR